ncbi:MAG: NERD domain-containing protein [Candidatus Eremiobacteraeota bacterium]|nr:NERD domain-containing protein [Candidatus Eremiobacteraeota bacterium]
MSRIFPDKLSAKTRSESKSKAEIRLYDECARQLGDSWTVFYHIAWLGLGRECQPYDGETDFIAAHPEFGVLLIEVKGGKIRYEGKSRQWVSIDFHGNEHEIDDPFKQVTRSKYALLEKIKSLRAWKDTFVELYHAVAFPEVKKPSYDITPDSPPDIIIDCEDMQHLPRRLEEIFSFWRRKRSARSSDYKALISTLEWMLAKTVTLENPLRLTADEEEREIVHLTEQQFRLLDFLSRNRKAAIGGCAGSGKSFMALEKAKRLAQEGFRTLLTCYNRPLSEFLQRLVTDIPGLTAANFHRLCFDMATAAGIPLEQQQGREFFEKKLPEVLLDAMNREPRLLFDAIIVDEGQDFHELWWTALEGALASADTGVFYVFYDDNQRIYRNELQLPFTGMTFSLNENIRNTKAISQVISRFYSSPAPFTPRGPSGRSVEMIPCRDKRKMISQMGKLLHRLITVEGFSPGDITVLSMRSVEKENSSGFVEGETCGNFVLRKAPSTPTEVQLSTVHSFKGLENRVVILTELNSHTIKDVSLVYVALSRPRNHLIVMGDEEALAALSPTH